MNRGRERVSTAVSTWLNPAPGVAPEPVGSWTRPSDWVDLSDIPSGTEKIYGLYAVYDSDTNIVAFSMSGAYTVDWGDGSSVENFATGVTATHSFDYDGLDAGTECTRGYRQSIVTITPQVGSHITAFNFGLRPSPYANTAYQSQWLDMRLSVAYCTSPDFYTVNISKMGMVEQILFLENGAMTNCSYLFASMYMIQSIQIDTSSTTNFTYMFEGCGSLQYAPEMDTSNATNFTNIFSGCDSLLYIPSYDTSKVTNMYTALNSCYSLTDFPTWDLSKVTTCYRMCLNCISLRDLPELNLPECTEMRQAFDNCDSLKEIPSFTLGKLTGVYTAFGNCAVLRKFSSTFDTSKIVSANRMFFTTNIKDIEGNDFSSATDFQYMFYQATSTDSISIPSSSLVSNFSNTCYRNYSLKSVEFNMSSATITTNTFTSCWNLQKCILTGLTVSISLDGCALGREALVELFTSLGTGTGQTLTITNNWGTATLDAADRAIATDKGWTLAE